MKFWVGVTDKGWFDFLSKNNADEVNFWQPSEKPLANFLAPGSPFLFKLHHPNNYIVGGGFFVRFSSLPLWLAWAAFGIKNGVANQKELLARLGKYRRGSDARTTIGCNVLAEPFFLPQEKWIRIPPDWQANIVRGKTYSDETSAGAALWAEVRRATEIETRAVGAGELPAERYGAEFLTRARLGQGAFRVLVTDAYQRRCAISGEKTLPVLEAAHIQAYAEEGPHRTANGLLLRSDLHTLFDARYITVTPDKRVLVSKRIKEEFENGREYYKFHSQPLAQLPASDTDQPSTDYLRWHNDRFLG